LSNIGVVIWSAAAGVCFFTYGIIRARGSGDANPHFFLAAGLITLLLLLDDLFMLHEVVFPVHLGVPEDVVYATHACLLLWFLVWFRSVILQSSFLLLVLAFAGFSVSIGVDLTASLYFVPGLYVFEDGGKLFGIVSWTGYFVLVSARYVVPRGYQDMHGSVDAAPRARGANRSVVRS
jgi:hypothetical protein